MWIVAIIGLVLIIASAILLWTGRRTQGKVNLLRQAVPTTAARIADAFPGELVSLYGTARSERELISQQAHKPCVYYEYAVVREYEETRPASSSRRGRSTGGTTRHRGSETIADHREWVPFFIEDDTGRARVYPEGAEFDAQQVVNRFEAGADGAGNMSLGGINISFSSYNSRTLGYRYTESIVPADTQIFVLGVVDENGQIAKPGQNRENARLIVSHRTEDSLRESWERSAQWQAYAALACGAIGLVMVLIAVFQAAL